MSIKYQVFSIKCQLKQFFTNVLESKISYSGEKQANKKPILVQMQSFDSRIWTFWLVVWPHNGSTKRIEMSGAEKSRLEIIPSTYHCYIQGRNPPKCIQKLTTSNNFDVKNRFRTTLYTNPSPCFSPDWYCQIKIDNSKFKIWNQHKKLSEIESSLANSFKIFIFNVPKQQKCTFEGHDLVMSWGVKGFQAFILSPPMII